MNFKLLPGLLVTALVLNSCTTSVLKFEKEEQLGKNAEFEQAVKIVKPEEPPVSEPATAPVVQKAPEPVKTPVKNKKAPVKTVVKAPVKEPVKLAEEVQVPDTPRRQPEIEDDVDFNGRRPLKDPFRVGEEVVHNVHYFKVSAGELRMKVEPFVMVNNRKAYSFVMAITTSSLFSTFYSVDDRVETFVDYEDLVPRVFRLHVKESGQLREAKMLFDVEKNTATFWEKKVTKARGEEEKKQNWEILPFTQNVYSAIYYMRNFKWEIGKEYSFRVANDKENLIFSGKALRREVLETKLGPMNAIVVQPNFYLKGKFQPIGDNFIWLSDDDRKFVLRIESKIKIGTLISEVVSITPGR